MFTIEVNMSKGWEVVHDGIVDESEALRKFRNQCEISKEGRTNEWADTSETVYEDVRLTFFPNEK